MTAETEPAGDALDIDTLLEHLRAMHEIRHFEDRCQELFTAGSVRGSTHLCQGQEATVVGACRALAPGDRMLCTYRGHGAVLAMGARLDRSFGEILGKADGLCRGKGGSMHLTDVEVGALGSFAIIGGHLPVALGIAFAARYRGTDEVCLCFFGDGAVNIGAFHESLNLAAVWRLPVIFVCENNLYGEYSPIASTTAVTEIARLGSSYAITSESIDGNDVEVVHRAISEAAARGRRGEGPTLIESLTYRQKGHSRSDPATYRPPGELDAWLKRDPILLLEQRLRDAGADEARLTALRDDAQQAVDEALEAAKGWPDAAVESRLEDVYA